MTWTKGDIEAMRTMRNKITILLAILCVLCLVSNAFALELKLPTGIKTVEVEAFQGIGATTVVIPEGTESIQSKAFADNSSLSDVFLPESKVVIAEDAFDARPTITFHAIMGSENAQWAIDHGYEIAYDSGGSNVMTSGGWNEVASLVENEQIGTSNNDLYYTHRLIVCLKPGYELPNLSSFDYKKIVPVEDNHYVIQFENSENTRECAEMLKSWTEGCEYAEADYFISERGTVASNSRSALRSGRSVPSDPMGFALYREYLGNNVIGTVTIAVIDTGVNSDQVSCVNTSLSYDFVNSQKAHSGFTDPHGTNVAQVIVDSFGSLKNHLSIISYRVVRPNDGRASYLMVGKAIKQAKQDGAHFVNISQVFESPYIKDQDNRYLQEAINYFGVNKVYAAAGNNAAQSAQDALPARYCQSVTGAQYGSDGATLIIASGTASGAKFGGFDTTTSFATAKVVAARALLTFDPDSSHTLLGACSPFTHCEYGMPDLSRYAVTQVESIIINDGEGVESPINVGMRPYIYYNTIPENATDSQVDVEITPADGSVIEMTTQNQDAGYIRIKAVGPGTATITFTSHDGNAQPVLVTISVVQPVNSVQITGDTNDVLMKGETLPLSATVLPANASDKNILWTSSNTNIATVSQEGVVTQVGNTGGIVTITATSKSDPDVYDSVTIETSAVAAVANVTVSSAGGIGTLYVGKTAGSVQMSASVLPEDADQTVTWSVEPADKATISSDGILTAVADGDVVVVATSVSSGKKGYKGMTIIQQPTSVAISGDSSVVVNNSITLTATVSPNNARNKEVVWSSNDSTVAEVSQSGVVTGKKAGSTVIFASSVADGTVVGQKTITVTVMPSSVTINQPSSTTMDIGGTLTLSATVSPSNASNKTIAWSTSDSSIATVSDGVVTAKASGTVKITATTVNGKTAEISLTVRQPYTLVFDANGGSCSTSSVTVYSGYQIGNVLPTPTWTYHTFAGWYTSKDGGTKLTSTWSTTCATTYTVYAHWTTNTCTITYDANGGSCSTSTKAMYCGDAIGTLPTATRTHYSFDGWYTAASGGNKVSTTTTFTTNTTLYAHWTRLKCTITYNANGGSCGTSSVTINQGDAIGSLATPTRSYYTFDSWYTAASGGTKIATTTTFTSNSTIYAHWTPNNYTYSIVYKSSNGTSLGSTTMTKAYGSSATVTPPAYTGYTTPSAQTVNWDASSKTVTFTYSPNSVAFTTDSGNFWGNGHIKYSAEIQYQNRTADSVQIRIVFTLTRNTSTYTQYRHTAYGSCGGVNISSVNVVPFNAWKSASSTDTKRTGTTSWATIPLTTTGQTTLSVKVECWQYNSGGTKMTSSDYARVSKTVTVSIPAY